MWTSLCNFVFNKLFQRSDVGLLPPRSDGSCGAYGKRLKLFDRIWNTNGSMIRTKSCSLPMQKENFDISDDDDDDDCCIIVEIPRRKKAVNSVFIQKNTSAAEKSSELKKSLASFSFKKDSSNDITQDKLKKDRSLVAKLSEKNDRAKMQAKKFFNTQRASTSQGKSSKCRATFRNYLKKKLNFLQESYRLNEKFQYIQLLQSHTTYNIMTVGQPYKALKAPEKVPVVIDLSKEEISENKGKTEEQEIQILDEIRGTSGFFQNVLTCRPLNVELALKAMCPKNLKPSSSCPNTSVSTINLDEDDVIYEKPYTLEEKMQNFMQITVSISPEESSEFHYLPEFTWEQEKKIQFALRFEPRCEVLVEGFGLQITRQDMQTLVGLNWLNDEIINFYMNLIMERSKLKKSLPKVYAFNTFFYPKLLSGGHESLKRWTKKMDIFSFDMILVPIHLGMHWCLAVVDFRSKSINYYDSLGSPNNLCLESLMLYLKAESLDKRQKAMESGSWRKSNVEDIPQQMNGGDCGVFSCMFGEYLARDCSILFTQDEMPYFRKKMAIEIYEKKLLT